MTGRGKILSLAFFIVLNTCVFSSPFTLHFSAALQTDSTEVFPGSFRALGRTASEPNSPVISALLQPPSPPSRSYVQIAKIESSERWFQVPLVYEPNATDLLYTMTLTAYDAVGLSGSCVMTLENPEALPQVPSNSLVYLRRFDAADIFVQSYDLSDPANHTIQWEISEAEGKFARMDLLIVDRCRAADLMISDSINLADFIVLAADWNRSGSVLSADIFLDEKVDLKDLTILVDQWLCSCME